MTVVVMAARPLYAAVEGLDVDMTREPSPYVVRDSHFLADVCTIIDREARLRDLPRQFIARLIHAESGFQAGAVSPKGAQGIAQFMPGTADLRRLEDPFNAAEAVPAAIRYLAELRRRFGNLGLAAAAYNAGEARVAAWLDGRGGLPDETRRYVRRITGIAADDWKERKDEVGTIAAVGKGPFRSACIRFAEGGGPGMDTAPTAVAVAVARPANPWGAQVAQGRTREAALALFDKVRKRHAEAIGDGDPMIVPVRNAAFGRARRMGVAVGADSRQAAMKICTSIRQAGGYCVVVKAGKR